jgi:hypothetical protein
MADNTQLNVGAGGDLVASDELTTINGNSAPAGLKVQRVKAGFGVDGDLTDVSSSTPFPVTDAVNNETQQYIIGLLSRMTNYLNSPQGYDKSQQRQRNTTVVESGTITTVSTVTNQTSMGGIQAQLLVNAGNLAAWNAVVRSRIT